MIKRNAQFVGAFAIGASQVDAVPVLHIGPAIAFYTLVLGFELRSRGNETATLARGGATIGLQVNDQDPQQASFYFSVIDVDALHHELSATGIEPSEIAVQQHDGKSYRVCFAREPYGVCFCFGEPAPEA